MCLTMEVVKATYSGGRESNFQQAPAHHPALQLQACMWLLKV